MDSFYEYLLKSYVLFEEKSDLEKFLNVYKAIKSFMRRGRRHCNHGFGPHPFYVNVNMESGDTFTQWVDSLQAAMPGLQVKLGFYVFYQRQYYLYIALIASNLNTICCLGSSRRFRGSYLSSCILLRNLEAIWLPSRTIQLELKRCRSKILSSST